MDNNIENVMNVSPCDNKEDVRVPFSESEAGGCGLFEFCDVKPELADSDESMEFVNYDMLNEDDEVEMKTECIKEEEEDNLTFSNNLIDSVPTATRKILTAKSDKGTDVVRKILCIAPNCLNTNRRNPQKIFFRLPKNDYSRRQWLTVLRQNPDTFHYRYNMHFVCEDHFNLEEDMFQYEEFKLFGGIKKLKANVLPHIFKKKTDSRKSISRKTKVASVNRARKKMLKEYLSSNNLPFTVNNTSLGNTIAGPITSASNFVSTDLTSSQKQSKITSDLNNDIDNSKNDDDDYDDADCDEDDDEFSEDDSNEDSNLSDDDDFSDDNDDDDTQSDVQQNKTLPYKCHLCAKSYETAICLKAHMLFHGDEKCEICSETFKTKYLLALHMSTKHELPEKALQRQELHEMSLQINEVIRKYACPVCDNKYTRKSYLIKHLQKHENAKVFACDMCNLTFVHKDQFIRHTTIDHSQNQETS